MGMLDDAPPGQGQQPQPDQLKQLYISALMDQTDPRQFDPTMVGSFADPAQQQIVTAMNQASQRAVLNRIASGESPDYNTIYRGQQFTDYSDHPHVAVPIPGTHKVSTAAGLYQMTYPTWESEKAKLGLSDFSPPNQDAAAWDLADTTYQQKTGHSLMGDATIGNVNWNALAKQWPSLRGAPPGPP